MKKEFVHRIESILPTSLVKLYRKLKRWYIINISLFRNKRNLRRLAGKDIYNVLFFIEKSSLWKYNALYGLMEQSKHFNPIIIVCPNITLPKDEMIRTMLATFNELNKDRYHVIKGYDEARQMYINVRDLDPHIIFFTSAWEGYVDKRFHISQYTDVLTCYMNYGWATTPFEWSFVTNVSLRVWRYWLECKDYNRILKQWTPAKNAIVTGAPMYEVFINIVATGKDWKIRDSKLKRVIYAPHHSIPEVADGILALSTFLIHYETMLDIAEQYKDKIQFVFKPHPLLLNHLYLHSEWGREKADAYYDKWKSGETTNFVNGGYIDLFKTSDAIIHDCSSFTIEYLYTKKPALFLSNIGHEGQANKVALRAYDAHYKAKTKEEICNFLDNVVLKGNDPKRLERESFYNDVLLPPNGRTASKNILHEISKSLKIHEDSI